MSRHRLVQSSIRYNDYHDDDDDYDDYDDDYGYDEEDAGDDDGKVAYVAGSAPSKQPKAAQGTKPNQQPVVISQDIVDQVRAIVGDDYSDSAIRAVLLSNSGNIESAVNELLDGPRKDAGAAENGRSGGTSHGHTPFAFDSPSPDDIVASARAGTSVSGGKKAAEKAGQQKKAATSQPTGPKQSSTPTKAPSTPKSKSLALGAASPALTPSSSLPKVNDGSANNLATSLQSMRVGTPGPSSNPGTPKSGSKRINVAEAFAERSSEKDSMNLVVVGHVDAGKSTLMGHMLYLLGVVDDRTMKKYVRDAEKMKKGSFAFAWVLDETEEERSRGVTIDVAVSSFETPHRKFTLLDAPGHRDFIPNMISGASQADAAMLVVDSSTNGFESGFGPGGQTREHALLVRSLGVSQLIVAVNQMDTVGWSESRFEEIRSKLLNFLVTQAGFKKDKLIFIPASGFTGENLLKRQQAELESWYTGLTVAEALDTLQPPSRPIDKPFRLSITDFFKGAPPNVSGSGSSLAVTGRIEAGSVQLGEVMALIPGAEKGTVKAIELNEEAAKWAVAGDHVTLGLAGIDIEHVSVGSILCDPTRPVPVTNHFRAKIVTFDIAMPLTIGVPVVMHHQSATHPATLFKLTALLNKATGEIVKKNPRALLKQMSAEVEIKTTKPICLETSKDSKELGRFMLRAGPSVVAAGIVTEIVAFVTGASE
ncbi:P-loop containing nucleoside triphosphate hydrolase protein [Zopfochytrium polystomum]|nr:P-loop containing nucleoside triphosphate hydrolase protein [Zopfochytrium polystomum]